MRLTAFLTIVMCFFLISMDFDHDTEVKFVWTSASGDVDHYNVYVSTDEGEYVLVGITSETSYTIEGSDGHTYKIKVEAVDVAGNVGPISEESDPVTVSLPSYVDITVLLEGPYESDKIMRTGLTIPTISPYADAKKVKVLPENAVDWVYVELRSNETTKVRGESMFLLSDGKIADYKGDKKAKFNGLVPGSYYVVIHQRNHLTIMSKTLVALVKSGDSSSVDLTIKDNVYGVDAVKELASGIYGMYAGDADSNGQIQTIDKNDYWRSQVGTNGYKSGDFNLDGEVQTIDKNDYWRPNVGIGTQVPEL